MTILDQHGRVIADTPPERCNHGVMFDEAAARALLSGWQPVDETAFVMQPWLPETPNK